MKLLSWNVNGLRAVMKKGFLDFVKKEDPDILCLQEVRASTEQIKLELENYLQFWNSAEKKGYSGTLVLTKQKPITVEYGLGNAEHDSEGRIITVEFQDLYLITVYTPNSGRELERLEYRKMWDREFLHYLQKMGKKKPVIFCGDLNVAHKEIDLKNPENNRNSAGFTDQEREGFDRIIQAGFIDSFREFNKEGGNYTWWSYMFNSRAKNIGWRIDYFCLSPDLRNRLKTAFILPEVMGSDHCPVGIILE